MNIKCCDHFHDFHLGVGCSSHSVVAVANEKLDEFACRWRSQQAGVILFVEYHRLVANKVLLLTLFTMLLGASLTLGRRAGFDKRKKDTFIWLSTHDKVKTLASNLSYLS